MLISAVETWFLGDQKKALLVKMFEKIVIEAVKMLIFFFWAMIAGIIVYCWMPNKRR